MADVLVDGLTFVLPDGWRAQKYDETSFYRNQFGKLRDGIKAIDLLLVDPEKTAWFVEVKDYRANRRTKISELDEEVAQKVFDTLAALLPAKVNANDVDEQQMAAELLHAKKLRVVLHLEQPAKHSALRPRAFNPADVQQKLRRRLKPIDPHPLVVDKTQMRSLSWSVA